MEAGEGNVLDVHHATPLSDGGSNRLWNLELLCVNCHNARHNHDITDG
ncbi:HNH endonuclease [Halocatena pleomorpha]|uniref:HNH endonuclease n=1 Tax=Halocatena pleomorpha TaxID=1785090 RepID=A0A3P3R950_9EURY|nr:HNH endonuclease [Halocatena pleomorpha]